MPFEADTSSLIEIGPGPGAMTRELLKMDPKNLLAIEKDSRFKPILNDFKLAYPENFDFVLGDALTIDLPDFATLPPDATLQIVGNLPFCVASPLLLRLIRESTRIDSKIFPQGIELGMLFMFQKEVARRICADVGHGGRSKISVLAQYYFEIEYAITVPRTAFRPSPKVDGGVVSFIRRPRRPIDFDHLRAVVNLLFKSPRKMLRSLAGETILGTKLEELPSFIRGDQRPASLSLEQIESFCSWIMANAAPGAGNSH